MSAAPKLILPEFVGLDFKAHVFEATDEEYHDIRNAVHSSSLKHMLKSPHAYMYYAKNPIVPTKQMKLGTIAHHIFLYGWDYFKSQYVIMPKFKGYTLNGKETHSMNALSVKIQYDEWRSSLPEDVKIVDQEELNKTQNMMESISNHDFVMAFIKGAKTEHKKIWRDPITGLLCVSSDDLLNFDLDAWGDFKTTNNCDWDHFRRNGAEGRDYYFQESFYDQGIIQTHGRSMKERVWIACENVPPFEVRVHYVDPYYSEVGHIQVRKAMSALSHSIKNDYWKMAQRIIEVGEASPWFKNKHNDEVIERMAEKNDKR